MKSHKASTSIVSLIVMACLLAFPLTAFAKKGKDHFNQGMKYEQAQQWDKAAQEFTLALAADPSNPDFQLHYRRAIFNASQMFMQQGRALAEQRDYVGAYNAFRQAFGYDPVNQLAVSEMERMLRLQEVKEGGAVKTNGNSDSDGTGGTPAGPGNAKAAEEPPPQAGRPEQLRVVNYNGDLKHYIRTLAEQLSLNVIFDKQTFQQPRTLEINLTQPTTTAKALDYIFLQEGLFFQKLDRHTILVADQARRPMYQQLVVRTFFISNADPEKVKGLIAAALPASVGRPQSIVVADKDTNSLTVRDTAENVRLIGELIQSVDKDRAEVVMDVNIYEVSRTDLLNFGHQLGDDTSLVNLGGVRSAAATFNGLTRVIAGTGATAAALPVSFGAALILPASAIQALQSKNRTKLIASTQVHAFNGEESKARIGQRVPVQTAQAYPFGVQTGQPNQTSGNIFPTGGFPVINYEPTGLTLTFTPQVFPNLDVQVKMNIESKDVLGAGTLTPTFTERTITGTARVQNNRTMLLASVSQDVETQGRRGIPFLSGLPVLGRLLFTAPTRDNRQVDIVIAVTPRVLRAPALTPRDEEMRPSGTLQSPTTGSLEAMLQETAREEQIASARRIPKEVTVTLPDQPAYVPAPKTDNTAQNVTNNAPAQTTTAQVTNVAQTNNGTAAKTEPAALTTDQVAKNATTSSTDSAMPQPKTASFAPTSSGENKLDVATAIKNVVTPTTDVSTTSATTKTDANVTTPVEDLAPKPAVTTTTDPPPAVIGLGLTPEKSDMTVGEKRQLALEFSSTSPVGMAVVMLRFDPKVLKVTNVTAGKMFADPKSAPMITQMKNEDGMLLLSVTPAAGSPISGEGALLNIEVEAIGTGDSSITFDLSNVHMVTSDGSASTLQLSSPVMLTVKPAPPAAKPVEQALAVPYGATKP